MSGALLNADLAEHASGFGNSWPCSRARRQTAPKVPRFSRATPNGWVDSGSPHNDNLIPRNGNQQPQNDNPSPVNCNLSAAWRTLLSRKGPAAAQVDTQIRDLGALADMALPTISLNLKGFLFQPLRQVRKIPVSAGSKKIIPQPTSRDCQAG